MIRTAPFSFRGRRLLLAAAALLALLLTAAPAQAAVTPIAEGSLTWGVKESWRAYIGAGTVSDGASVNPDGTYDFPVVSGSYDDESRTTTLQLAGSVHWQSYPDYPVPGRYGLDTTLKDLSLEIGPAAQVVRGTSIGYSREDPGGELHTEVGVDLAKLDVAAASTSFAGGVSEWSAIPSAAGAGLALYPEGTPIDPVSVSYQGPGGVPDLGEHWDEPGQIVLEPEGRWVSANPRLTQNQEARRVFADGSAGVVHVAELYQAGSVGAKLRISAHDPVSLAPVGTPLELVYPQKQGQYFKFGFDPETDSIFYVTGREGAGANETTVRRATWNAGSQSYDTEVVGQLAAATVNVVGSVAWNGVAGEVAVTANSTAPAGFNQIADLYSFKRVDGAWQMDQDPLVVPETGELAGLTKKLPATLFATATPLIGSSLAVARDGSYVQAPSESRAIVAEGAKVPVPALRIQPDWDGQAQVSALWETQLPEEAETTYFGWSAASVAADGSVLLHGAGSRLPAYVRVDVDENGPVVGEVVDSPQGVLPDGNFFATSMAGDPVRGWDWATDRGDPDGYTVLALSGDTVISRFAYPDLVPATGGFPAIGVGPDGALYLPVLDKDSDRYGYQRLGIAGVLAKIGQQPADAAVSLGVDEESEQASFSSAAVGGEPAPSRQWQVKAPGASSFVDLPGETGPSLTVAAEPGMDGSQYRAVYASAAGAIVSSAATLSVDYAPRLLADVPNRSVTEGTDATFLVAADGHPEPTVAWQRRVGGFWQPIAADDENFAINGPSLTVLETNTEQTGALFRAKIANSAGAIFSRAAKLTVDPPTSIPPEGLDLTDVSLTWSGNAEMQKAPPAGGSSYFSAGASTGKEPTYRSVDGDVAVFQVAAAGTESVATWATRAAHVGSGGKQLVRLYGGEARIEPDGSATVGWQGTWTVNFYGGLVPFTFADPELTVAADGSGSLTATMGGCASSQANPNECVPFAPVPDVTVATFADVEIDPEGEVAIAPDYAGVEVDVPVPYAPQHRSGIGWGAWPQSFVDFQAKTGLTSYWYTSNSGFDPDKPPAPFTVDFEGATVPEAPEVPPPGGQTPSDPPPAAPQQQEPAGSSPTPQAQAAQATQPGHATVVPDKLGRPLVGKRPARLATLTCPAGASCAVKAPRRVGVRIADRRYSFVVVVPRRIGAGKSAALRLRLPGPTRAALAERGRRTTVKLRVRAGGEAYELRVTLRGVGRGKVRLVGAKVAKIAASEDAPAPAPTAPRSEPIAAAAGPLARPASAVDVSDVRIVWYPRDSWVRYASSGVAPGDGIAAGNGATGRSSTASACPDRPSTSDAQLPYAIEFAPKASWYDPVSGSAGVYGQGSVSFRWKAHTIDLTAADPEIEIAGAASRAIFRFQGSGGTPYPDQRASLVSLDASGRPTVSNGGRTFTYDLMRGTLTEDGVKVFAGFYTPPDNDEFGCVSVSFTTP